MAGVGCSSSFPASSPELFSTSQRWPAGPGQSPSQVWAWRLQWGHDLGVSGSWVLFSKVTVDGLFLLGPPVLYLFSHSPKCDPPGFLGS